MVPGRKIILTLCLTAGIAGCAQLERRSPSGPRPLDVPATAPAQTHHSHATAPAPVASESGVPSNLAGPQPVEVYVRTRFRRTERFKPPFTTCSRSNFVCRK